MASIEKINDNKYRIVVSKGYDIHGKKKRTYLTWTNEKKLTGKNLEKELTKQKILFEQEVKNGLVIDDKIKFVDFQNEWLKLHALPNLSANTVNRYKDMLIDINNSLGNYKMSDIDSIKILSFYNVLRKTQKRGTIKYIAKNKFNSIFEDLKVTKMEFSKKSNISTQTLNKALKHENIDKLSAEKISGFLKIKINYLFDEVNKNQFLSETTIARYHELLSSIFKSALLWKIVKENPLQTIKKPKVNDTDIKYLNEEEARKFISLLNNENDVYKVAMLLGLFGGMRRSEIIGLKWNDIDFDNKTIYINNTGHYIKKIGYFDKSTKTKQSKRIIVMNKTLENLLSKYKSIQDEYKNILGEQWIDTNKVICTWNGDNMNPDTLSSWLRKFVKNNDFKNITMHSLRHTNATLQIVNGVDVRTVANRLGHAKTSTTLNIYTHFIERKNKEVADLLENILIE